MVEQFRFCVGGFEDYSLGSFLDKPVRLDLLRKAVKEINADVTGLVDTFRWKQLFTDDALAGKFGYRYARQINLEDHDPIRSDREIIGIVLLSNNEIADSSPVRLKTRNALRTKIISDKKVIDVLTVYLTDLSEEERLEQVRCLIELVNPTLPTVIMGDFNSVSLKEIDKTRSNFENFLKENPDFKKRPDYQSYFKPAFSELIKGRVVSLIKSAGFKDGSESGTKEATAWTRRSPYGLVSVVRVDYVFLSPGLKGINYRTWKGGVFERASDHYPISVDVL